MDLRSFFKDDFSENLLLQRLNVRKKRLKHFFFELNHTHDTGEIFFSLEMFLQISSIAVY